MSIISEASICRSLHIFCTTWSTRRYILSHSPILWFAGLALLLATLFVYYYKRTRQVKFSTLNVCKTKSSNTLKKHVNLKIKTNNHDENHLKYVCVILFLFKTTLQPVNFTNIHQNLHELCLKQCGMKADWLAEVHFKFSTINNEWKNPLRSSLLSCYTGFAISFGAKKKYSPEMQR